MKALAAAAILAAYGLLVVGVVLLAGVQAVNR